MAALEIYNKPLFHYRDECVVIMLLNAWELLLKAILSSKGKSVFYRKKRKEPYRTLSWRDALKEAEIHIPRSIGALPIRRNLELLGTYRDNSVHFYNAKDFGVLLYALAQTCIKNFRDVLDAMFGIKLEDAINWQLLPLGIKPPLDVLSYISGAPSGKASGAVRQFMAELARSGDEIKRSNEDGGRLLTIFNVKLESVKKMGDADVVIGVRKGECGVGPLAIIRSQDPNITHPLRQREVVNMIVSLHGEKFTTHVFQAIVWKYRLKDDPRYCWKAKEGVLTRYSNDILMFIKHLTRADFDATLKDYRVHHRAVSRKRKNKM